MKKFFAIYVLLMALQVQQANAGVLLEPYIGYEQAPMDVVTVTPTDVSATDSGMFYGVRAGYRFADGLWLGAEYSAGSGNGKPKDATQADSTYSKSAMSAVVGYDHGDFRVWGGYGLSDKMTFKDTTGETNFTGTNYKLGVGYKPVPSMSVNLEYLVPTYTKYNMNGGTDADVSTMFSKMSGSSTQLSVSMPFDFAK